ncbi:MAG: N-6 DNA methylase [Nostoc sp.]|uniref:N-6 DNA methylase n=1 Tax=Nostoc sp. TaxID=1180 RepID=UPI002FF807A7
MMEPKLGETIFDPAYRTGGFLVEAYEYLKKNCSAQDWQILQKSIIGGEAKSLPLMLAHMSLLLDGFEYPDIDNANSLRFTLSEMGEKDWVDVILTKSEDWIDINPTEKYKQVTVKIWGKGVVERNEVTGAKIAASKRLKVHYGQFILSRIDARHGAFGLIPNSLDGAVITNDFPVFTPNSQKILPQFLDWMSKTKDFIELCKAASEGTTNRVRLKEDKFLSMKIPLPAIEEQRRIVARVEELVGKFEEVRSLRQQVTSRNRNIFKSIFSSSQEHFTRKHGKVQLDLPNRQYH